MCGCAHYNRAKFSVDVKTFEDELGCISVDGKVRSGVSRAEGSSRKPGVHERRGPEGGDRLATTARESGTMRSAIAIGDLTRCRRSRRRISVNGNLRAAISVYGKPDVAIVVVTPAPLSQVTV
jgi:hypothetical protein